MTEDERKLLEIMKALRPDKVTFDELIEAIDSEEESQSPVIEQEK